MTRTVTIPAAASAVTPRIDTVAVTGLFLLVQSATKNFNLKFVCPRGTEVVTAREGERFTIPANLGGRFNQVEIENTSTNDSLTVTIDTGNVIVDGNGGNRVPPTRLSTKAGTLNNGAEFTQSGVNSSGQRRKQFAITVKTANAFLDLLNDGTIFGAVGCLSANMPVTYTLECDANIKVQNNSGVAVDYAIAEVFYL